MPSTRLTPFHKMILSAQDEARAAGAHSVEAEHLLLALTGKEARQAHDILASAGLDHEKVSEAIEAEFEESLSAAGIRLEESVPVSRARSKRVRMSRSSKLAIERATRMADPKKRIATPIEPIHLLVGVLKAEEGTVPRALSLAGVDRDSLVKSAEDAL